MQSEHPSERDPFDVFAQGVMTLGVMIDAGKRVKAQEDRWGVTSHPHGTGRPADRAEVTEAKRRTVLAFDSGEGTWRHILDEEVAKARAEAHDPFLRAQLLEVAAVCVSWAKDIDRRGRES
jgi:hypothetical protein